MVFSLHFGQISFNLLALATSIVVYDILPRACTEIQIFFGFSFSPFSFLFAAVIGLLLDLLRVKKNFEEIVETGKFDHGVAMYSGRKFCSEFFIQLCEHLCAYLRRHKAGHSDLGIIGKIFSSCRS